LASVSKRESGQLVIHGKNATNILGYPLPSTFTTERVATGIPEMSSDTGKLSNPETAVPNFWTYNISQHL
jgi:hypothetical protein